MRRDWADYALLFLGIIALVAMIVAGTAEFDLWETR
jgi:hypothetical protein